MYDLNEQIEQERREDEEECFWGDDDKGVLPPEPLTAIATIVALV